MGATLLCLGLVPGDRIGIWSPNRYEWVLTQFASAKAGLILVNINPAYRLSELEFVLNKVGCKALVLAPAFKSSDYSDAEAMRRFWAEQIAHYKVPQHIRFVSEFPMTVTGKIQKFVVRERMIEELNLNLERGPT